MKTNRPNILYLTFDQQRYDCVSMSGMRPVRTPNLQRIADKGVYFENAYTPIPVCAPVRQALMTGKRPECFGGLWNPHIVFPVKMIPEGMYSWTRQVAASGYRTGWVGNWEADDQHTPDYYGFEKFVSRAQINSEEAAHTPAGSTFPNGFFGDSNPVPLEYSHTHLSARHVIEMIDEFADGDAPWYIHMDNPEPHLPCRPSAPFDTMYNPDEIEKWGGFDDTFEGKPYIQKQQVLNWKLENRTWDEWKRTVALYYGIISQYDDAVGRILDHLEEKGLMENTIILYTTDHGDMCGSHRMIDKHYNMYQDICHVPMAIRWDGHIVPGRFDGYVYQCLDAQPTLMRLIGEEIPAEAGFHGMDLSDLLLRGERDNGRRWAVSTYNGQQFGLFTERSICDGNYKYVWNLTDTDELYDLREDPYELHNIIHDESRADDLAALRVHLYEELTRCEDPIARSWTSDQLLKGRKL